jgi:hypothetical protein
MWYPTDHTLGLQRNGVNHVGMENSFRGQGFTEPVQGTTYPVTSAALLQKYADLGMRSARVVFSWESVQKNPDPLPRPFVAAAMGAVPFNMGGFGVYWTNLAKLVIRLIDRGVYVTVGLWQSNKNANNGKGDTDITYNDKSFDKEHFADFWGKFATAINQAVAAGFPPDLEFPANPNRPGKLAFDLINEPHAPRPADGTVGITVADWAASAQAAIAAIRANPANTNTIFVEGMGYASVRRDAHLSNPANPASPLLWELLNDPLKRIGISAHCYDATVKLPGEVPSAKPTKALANACADLVDFARKKGFKLHIGEIAVDAGVSACGTLATAKDQWNDWNQFCLENDDVLVGWNWWGNTSKTWGWSFDGSCSDSRTWALTQDDGNTWSPYVDVMQDQDSIPVPELVIRDNTADAGTEPNLTTTIAWESPDIWVRKTVSVIVGDEAIDGGTSAVVYVRVTNRGDRDYPGTGNDVVALYWAKASTALSIPEPWNGKVGGVVPNPIPGGLIGSAAIGAVPKKTSTMISIAWPKTPNPADYPVKDGHFCLLAVVAKNFNPLAQVTHEGLEAPLSASVLKMNNVGWHNIHIDAPKVGGGMMKLGAAVLGNPGGEVMRASLRLEVLDARARPVNPRPGSLRITLEGAALERLGRMEARRPVWEDMGDGSFAVLDSADAMPELTLQPGETLPLELSYAPDRRDRGYAVRATQYEREGAFRRLVGGQTFVIGEVAGFTSRRRPVAKDATWPWLVASGALLLLIAMLGGRARPGR